MIPEHVRAIFSAFAVAYPNWELFKKPGPEIEAAMVAWAGLLADCDPKELLQAAITHTRASKFAPTVAEIRERCTPPKDKPIGAEEAWVQVMDGIRRNGYMRAPKFADPRIARAIEAVGGWHNLATQLTTDVPMNRAHFLRCFAAYQETATDAREYNATHELLAKASERIGGGGRIAQLYGASYRDPLPDPTDVERYDRFERMRAEDPGSVDPDPY